jgi:hypothetical protein
MTGNAPAPPTSGGYGVSRIGSRGGGSEITLIQMKGRNTVLPSFQTSRLTWRQLMTADIEACLAMDRDPEVTASLSALGPIPSRTEHLSKLVFMLSIPRGWATGRCLHPIASSAGFC